jgi:hypothetical protein
MFATNGFYRSGLFYRYRKKRARRFYQNVDLPTFFGKVEQLFVFHFQPHSIRVEVYYEVLCPDSRYFILHQVSISSISKYLKIQDYFPWKSHKLIHVTFGWKFASNLRIKICPKCFRPKLRLLKIYSWCPFHESPFCPETFSNKFLPYTELMVAIWSEYLG